MANFRRHFPFVEQSILFFLFLVFFSNKARVTDYLFKLPRVYIAIFGPTAAY